MGGEWRLRVILSRNINALPGVVSGVRRLLCAIARKDFGLSTSIGGCRGRDVYGSRVFSPRTFCFDDVTDEPIRGRLHWYRNDCRVCGFQCAGDYWSNRRACWQGPCFRLEASRKGRHFLRSLRWTASVVHYRRQGVRLRGRHPHRVLHGLHRVHGRQQQGIRKARRDVSAVGPEGGAGGRSAGGRARRVRAPFALRRESAGGRDHDRPRQPLHSERQEVHPRPQAAHAGAGVAEGGRRHGPSALLPLQGVQG
mmetsp:Transcript_5019/g.10278  ORF Transcript_5019/g.10278 Transcript_5019/m.10278 type:complete len:253 (-) Transcript_5019:1489-2247(-)